jgi:Tol biopolymer transport system component
VYLLDRITGTLQAASVEQSNGVSRPGDNPRISPDGRYVVFAASHRLLPTDNNGSNDDVYRFDRVSGELLHVSLSPSGVQSGSLK